jgi:hypothetical protein
VSDVTSCLQFIKSSIGLYKAKKFAFTLASITSSLSRFSADINWLAFGRFDMGVEGESYRVRCADFFPPRRVDNDELTPKIANLRDDAKTSTIAP